MARLQVTLLTAVLVSAALAGCFHDDDKDNGGNGTPTQTPTPTNTTGTNGTNGTNGTDPFQKALKPPVPMFTFSILNETGDNLTAPYFAMPNENLTVQLDGSASKDPDGTIIAYSWVVTGPAGFSQKGTSKTLDVNITDLKPDKFGAYNIQFKVLDDDNVLNGTSQSFVINYENFLRAPDGMFGIGTASCSDPNDSEAGNAVPPTGVAPGTFKTHTVTVAQNASSIALNLSYTDPGPATTLGMYLLGPGTETTACDDALATAEPAATPVSLTHSGNLTAGQHTIRVELDGSRVAAYTVQVRIMYGPSTEA